METNRESVKESGGEADTGQVIEQTETKTSSVLPQPPAGIPMDAHEASLLNYLRADAVSRQRERRFACPFCGKCVRSKVRTYQIYNITINIYLLTYLLHI